MKTQPECEAELDGIRQQRRQDRAQAIQSTIDYVLQRAAQGEQISDESLMAEHAHLMPELAEQLRFLRMVQRATAVTDVKNSRIPISCPDCHAENWIDDVSSLSRLSCAACGTQFRLVNEEWESQNLHPSRMLGRFQLVRRIGAGAFGSVWQAADTKLDRQVAIKIPLRSREWAEEVQRLVREARLAAQLHHPHIVAVYEVGVEGELVFIVTDLIHGVDLRQWLQQRRPSQHGAATICADLADALEHAHARGIIHRDIKPSNILMDEQRRVYITDFGLAKHQTGEATMTVSGRLVGTPDYMPPELVRSGSQNADQRSDIYSLGVVLFEMLTGERPFRGDTPMVLHQTLTCDPPGPRRLNPHVHRDLDTICLKCLEKEPRNRYQSAGEVRAELTRFLEGRAIAARPLSPWGRSWRWCRRNVRVANLLVLLVSSILATAIIASIAAVNIQYHRQLAVREAACLALDRGLSLSEKGQVATGLLWMGRSLDLASQYDPQLDHVVRFNLAGWSQRVAPLLSMTTQSKAITVLDYSPDGRLYLSASDDGTVLVWNVAAGQLQTTFKHAGAVRAAKFSHHGRLIATGSNDKTARVWDALTGLPTSPALLHDDPVTSVDFSSDDRQLLTGSLDQLARTWDLETGKPAAAPVQHATAILAAWYLPNSSPATFVTLGGNVVQVWDANTQKEVGRRLEHSQPIEFAQLSQDGRQLLVGTGDSEPPTGEVYQWDLVTGELVIPPRKFGSRVSCVAFNPDGVIAVAGTQSGQLQCWDRSTGTTIRDDRPHEYEIRAVVFSPDGRRFATGSFDGTARIWNMDDGQQLGISLTHEHHLWSLAFHPHGTTLLTGGFNGITRLWEVEGIQPQAQQLGKRTEVIRAPWSMRAQFSPSGNLMVTGDQTGNAELWSYNTGQLLSVFPHPAKITALACATGDQRLAVGCDDGTIRFWGIAEQQLIATGQHTAEVTEIVSSPDGRWFLSGSHDHEARLWDAQTGQLVGTPWRHPETVWFVGFAPDSQVALTSSGDGTVRLWNVLTGEQHTSEFHHPYTAWEARFSRSGRRVLTGCGPSAGSFGQAQWWDVQAGAAVGKAMKHFGAVTSVALSPDEKLVATASFDGTAQLWNAETCEPVHEPLRHQGRVWTVLFSPDGQSLLTCSDDHTAQLWDVATGKPQGPAFVHPAPVRNADINGYGAVVTGSMDDCTRRWQRPDAWQMDERAIQSRIARLTGMKLTGTGVAVSNQSHAVTRMAKPAAN